MNLTHEDTQLLKELCAQHQVEYDKIVKLLTTVREYEFRDRRSGIYDALHEIIRTNDSSKGGAQ